MSELLEEIFSSKFFMPHGHCYLWKPGLVWLQTLSNGLIGLAYVAIAATLVALVRRVRQMPFEVMYLAFGLFIVFCGITHFFDVWVIWYPNYWIDGGLRGLTAVASVWTAVKLPPLLPKAQALAEAAALAHERGVSLERANRDLATLLDKTKELERIKTEFFANVSHELRTPLSLVIGPAERLLGDARLDQRQRRDVETIARHGRQLLERVNDLLDVAKLDAGKMTMRWVKTALGEQIRRCASPFESLAQERGIAFAVETPEKLDAELDPSKIERVVVNLLANAFKFTPDGGRVRLTLRALGGHAHLEVADSGPGIRKEDREVVFERFRQADRGDARQHGGTGLGLAIAKDFVTLHGGTIAIADAPEGGALLVVDWPMTAPADATVAPATPMGALAEETARLALSDLRARRAAPDERKPARGNLLVVEDNVELARFVADVFADDYHVELARDGAEGLDKAVASPPDAIITDMMMPGTTGEELIARARTRRELDEVPIIVLTARTDEELRVRLLRRGAQDYVGKPFLPEELRVRVENQVALKRTREMLQRELDVQLRDLEDLAAQVTARSAELRIALESARSARELAERASRYKSEFLGLVSHELKTPLTALRLQLDRLLRDREALGERQREALRRMDVSSRRLIDLIESLLEYARIEQGRFDIKMERFSLDELVGRVMDELRPLAEEKGLSLGAVGPAGLALESDPRVVRLVLENLVGNAIKFTTQGRVEVACATDGGNTVHVTVTDTGPGIPASERARVFEPFEQLEPIAKKHTAGIGLGLALVREMLSAVGGHVELESDVGRGSSFRVVFPATAIPVERAIREG